MAIPGTPEPRTRTIFHGPAIAFESLNLAEVSMRPSRTLRCLWLTAALAFSALGAVSHSAARGNSCRTCATGGPVPNAPPNGLLVSDARDRLAHLATEGVSPLTVKAAQSDLHYKGFYPGPTTGVLDAPTRGALRRYQRLHHLAPTGALDAATLRRLGLD